MSAAAERSWLAGPDLSLAVDRTIVVSVVSGPRWQCASSDFSLEGFCEPTAFKWLLLAALGRSQSPSYQMITYAGERGISAGRPD